MGRGKNPYSLPAGFNITGEGPIDSRFVVDDEADLTNDATWKGVGLYNGLVVTVLHIGELRLLTDKTRFKEKSAWISIKGGGSGGEASITVDIKDKQGNVIIPKDTSLTGAVSILVNLINNADDDISFVKLSENNYALRLNGISND